MKLQLFLILVTRLSVTLCAQTGQSQSGGIPGYSPGVLIWRVATKDVESIPNPIPLVELKFETHGAFIVLETVSINGEFKRLIYVWLGVYSSEEMHEFAGIHAERLNKELNNNVKMIYRVVENFEPPAFKALFPSVFPNEVETDVKLLRIKAETVAYFEELPPRIESLNLLDTFLLVSRNNLFIYPGKHDNEAVKEMYEKINPRVPPIGFVDGGIKAMKVPVVDQFNENCQNIKPFLKTLGASMESLKNIDVKPNTEGYVLGKIPEVDVFLKRERSSDAEELVEKQMNNVHLWEIYINMSKELHTREVEGWPLRKDMLKTEYAYVLMTSNNGGLFAWLGNQAHKLVRAYTIANASSHIEDSVASFTTPIRIIKEGQKNLSFDVLFDDFEIEELFEGRRSDLQPDVA